MQSNAKVTGSPTPAAELPPAIFPASDELDPLPQDGLHGSLRFVEALSIGEHDHCAILAQPLQQTCWIIDGNAVRRKLANLGAKVKDDADAGLGPEMRGGEVLRGTEAGSVPLDAFLYRRIDFKHQLSQGFNLDLVRMHKRGHECFNSRSGVRWRCVCDFGLGSWHFGFVVSYWSGLTFDMRDNQKAEPFRHPLDGKLRRRPLQDHIN